MNVVPFKDDQDVPEKEAGEVRIWLGCNQNPREGWVNVDIHPFPGVDVVADLEKTWPWDDNHADIVGCADLPEHIRMWWENPDWLKYDGTLDGLVSALKSPVRTYGIIHFMNEAWRVLKPGGHLDVLVPSTDGRGWAQDPTHVSYWNENSFMYFCDETFRGLYPHLIKAKFKPLRVATGIRNQLEINWVHAVLEAVK